MGRTYWFECPRCSYRAKVSGRLDRGVDFFVTTILCRDCKQLYDAVTRIRWPEAAARRLGGDGFLLRPVLRPQSQAPRTPPKFDAALNRLLLKGAGRFKWINFPAQCPVSQTHRVQSWNDPDKCPRCGMFLEKSALPYRIWE
jgi:hypothetical protein